MRQISPCVPMERLNIRITFSTNETSVPDEKQKKASGTDASLVAIGAKTNFTFHRNVWCQRN